jgi:carbon storage regulator
VKKADKPKERLGNEMLILTRRPGESLYLGDNIKLKILSVQGKQIKIGLDVPEDMTVYREEVYLKIKEQNRQALEVNQQDLLAAAALWQKKERKK